LSRELSASLRRNPDLDSWIRIGPRGRVGVFTGKAELGQGIKTAIARIAAEELDVSVERIDVQTADTASSPNELYTAGSSSVEESGNAVREAAAEARRRILARASEQLGVPVERLRVEDGTVSGPGGGRTTYWELMGGKAFHCRVSGEAPLKPPAAYRVVGKPGPRLDLRRSSLPPPTAWSESRAHASICARS
jgi:CO/xanthine dehydrogenase Mo-binding subunit